jgi:hypothetical protein
MDMDEKGTSLETKSAVQFFLFTFAFCIALLLSAGCGKLMHPKAGEILEQAKGPTGIDTQINLAARIEESITALRGQPNYETGLDTLHNQLYALKTTGCDVTEAQAKTTAYAKATTLRKEVGTICHRLWKSREDQARRDVHLDLLGKRVQELRETLQTIKASA